MAELEELYPCPLCSNPADEGKLGFAPPGEVWEHLFPYPPEHHYDENHLASTAATRVCPWCHGTKVVAAWKRHIPEEDILYMRKTGTRD